MKVILLADVKRVGQRGEIKEVAEGYAMNVLIPQKLALPGTPQNIAKAQKSGSEKAKEKAQTRALVEKSIGALSGKTFVIYVRANEKGSLFKAIRARDIAENIEASAGVSLSEKMIDTEPLNALGDYPVRIKSGDAPAQFIIRLERQD